MKTVFLIDDDLDDREIFQEALQSLNLAATYLEACDGQQAMDMMARQDFVIPDLMFIDLNMPRVGGLELLQKVRLNPDYNKVPVYIYSTSTARQELDKCMKAGATDFITKHNSFDELQNALKKMIENLPALQ